MPKTIVYTLEETSFVTDRWPDGTVRIRSLKATEEEKHEAYVAAVHRELEMVERRIAAFSVPVERPDGKTEHPVEKMYREGRLQDEIESRAAVIAELEQIDPTFKAARGQRPTRR